VASNEQDLARPPLFINKTVDTVFSVIEFGQYLINGISQGCLYCLLASGLTLMLGILGVPNFAHGNLYMLGAYIAFYVVAFFNMSYWLSIVIAAIILGVLGLIIYRLIFYPMRNGPHANLFVAAIALLMILESAALLWFGGETKWLILPYSNDVIRFGGMSLGVQRLIIILATLMVMLGLELFIKKTTVGAALEATAQNREGAMLCGIKVTQIAAMAFAIGTALAGVAGVLIAPAVMILPSMGLGPLLVAFSAVIVGGMGSIRGAVVGAFILALVESLTSGYISATYSLVFVFAAMILMLLIRPSGLFGKEL